MATVYSLLCFGGRTGKAVTISNGNPCVVTLTNHGLRDGFDVVLSTTGTLPAGVTAGVTYYAKSTGANTHNLYDTAANAIAGGTTGRIATTTAGSGTHTIKSAYRNGLTSDQLLRYGAAGSERIYDGLVSWRAARVSAAGTYDTEVCEISDPIIETISAGIFLNLPCAATTITTMVNGARSAAWHAGLPGASGNVGYTLYVTNGVVGFDAQSGGVTVDGIFSYLLNSSCGGIQSSRFDTEIKNCIIRGNRAAGSQFGIKLYTPSTMARVHDNICLEVGGAAFSFTAYQGAGSLIYNNIAHDSNVGFYTEGAECRGFFYNNISVGNTTNWYSAPPTIEGAGYNFGETGNVPWNVGVATAGTTITSASFVDYANNNFRPASASSPQVDAGVSVPSGVDLDMLGEKRPNYNNGASELWDVGAFEFDHGFIRPATSVTTFKGVKAGSEIRIYNSSQVELAGIESCSADHELSWTIPVGDVEVVIIHPQYKIKEFSFTSTEGVNSLPIQQDKDKWFSNP